MNIARLSVTFVSRINTLLLLTNYTPAPALFVFIHAADADDDDDDNREGVVYIMMITTVLTGILMLRMKRTMYFDSQHISKTII